MRSARPTARLILAVAAASIALVGCTGGEPEPREYGDVNTKNEGYYGNFMYGCTGVEANDDGKYVDVKLENADFCTCVFEGLKDKVNFDEMKEFEDAQAEAEPGTDITIPKNINSVRESCSDEATGSGNS